MRLAIFTNTFPGRVVTFVARDIAPLLRAGIDVEIFPFYPADPSLWRYVPEILSDKILDRSKIHHVDLHEIIRSLRRLSFKKIGALAGDMAAITAAAIRYGVEPLAKTEYVALKAGIWAAQADRPYDHILAYWGNYAATGAYIFRRLTNIQVPLSIFLHAGLDLYEKPVYMRQKLLDADQIITCSEFNRKFMHDHFSDIYQAVSNKIYVHHHGVDLSEFRFSSDSRPAQKILAIGGLYDYKGFDYLLRAGHELSLRGIDYEIELVGDGTEADSLKALAHQLQISDRVKFPGWVKPGNIPNLISQATIFVHPSSRLADGVPNVLKEAMAVGTPVIASRVAGIPELLCEGKYGLLVPPKDVAALANAIETLLANKTLRLNYAYEARKHVEEKHDVWRNGQKLAAMLCSKHRSPKNGNLHFEDPLKT